MKLLTYNPYDVPGITVRYFMGMPFATRAITPEELATLGDSWKKKDEQCRRKIAEETKDWPPITEQQIKQGHP